MTEIDIFEIAAETDLQAAFAIRRAVFFVEQGVPEALEIDGRDGQCRHYLVRLGETPIGTARVRPVEPGLAKIERVAVLGPHRGNGIGRRLMTRLLADLERAGIGRAMLHAQAPTESFYAALGFTARGAPFDEAGIAHIKMVRDLR